jgi:[ribosomal protein S18]-alanine N-acetyltransferase
VTTIRPALAADLDTIVVLELEVFGPQAWSPRSVEEEFAGLGETRAIWVAEAADDEGGQTPVGYAVGRYLGDVADVQRVAVLPSRRGHGLGRQLLDTAIDEARSRGCARVLLEVAADNEPAQALYRGTGFAEIDRRPSYYAGEGDAVVMAKTIEKKGSP